jgi:gliding motility-associated-like protein
MLKPIVIVALICNLFLSKAVAQSLRAWWNGDYKCIAHDTGLELRPWKLKYPHDINLFGETNAAFFDENDSLQFFFPTGVNLYKRSDSAIYKPVYYFDNQSCFQSALCYRDKLTDTLYFIGKPTGPSEYYFHGLNVIKIHPNRRTYSIHPFVISDSLDESLCAMKFNNGNIWAVLRKSESSVFTAVELKSLKIINSDIPHILEFQSGVAQTRFHPSGKFFFYSFRSGSGPKAELEKRVMVLNFNPETGQIGFRKLINIGSTSHIPLASDSTGIFTYNIISDETNNYFSKIIQMNTNEMLADNQENNYEFNINLNSPLPTRAVHATNNKIYFNFADFGYGVINHPDKPGAACDIKLVEVKNSKNSFLGWQESVPEQKKIPIDTFTFFSVPYPLNTVVGIPNAFTPNDDLVNDAFYLVFNPQLVINNFKVRIFSRWGVEIFQSEDPYFYWDGTFKNKPVPEGTYYYFINLNNETTGKSETHKGPLVLIR